MAQFLSRTLLAGVLIILVSVRALPDDPLPVGTVSTQNQVQRGLGYVSDLSVDVTMVLIPVMVTDRLNRLVTDLTKADFKIFDESKEEPILSFSSEDAPVSVGLVLDCSGSMVNKMQLARTAIARFLAVANDEDEFFLAQFSDRAQLVQPFTLRSEEILNRLEAARVGGATALFDAISLAAREMKAARHSRKALLIISDGGDNNSRFTESEVTRLIREADVQIFTIGIYGPRDPRAPAPEELAGPGLLARMAAQSAGRAFAVKKLDDLPEIAMKVGEALRHQYVLGYKPENLRHNGKYRRVDVKLTRKNGQETARISWRHGYYAPPQ